MKGMMRKQDDRTILANPATTDGIPRLDPKALSHKLLERLRLWQQTAGDTNTDNKNNNNNNNTTNNITTNNYYCYKNNLGGFFSNTSGAQWSLESSPNSNRSYRFGNRLHVRGRISFPWRNLSADILATELAMALHP